MLVTKRNPFTNDGAAEESSDEVVERNLKCDIDFSGEEWRNVSEEMLDFTKKLLSKNPSNRPTAA
jgi:hypothetical protein